MEQVYSFSRNDDEQPPGVVELIEKIRPRPELYLGERSVSALWHFLAGYHLGLRGNAQVSVELSPRAKEFHDWVAYRLHFLESTTGWRQMILKRTNDEAAGLNYFFELFDEYRIRQQRIVAKMEGFT
jgi:hypothetical protein